MILLGVVYVVYLVPQSVLKLLVRDVEFKRSVLCIGY
jgi:hypothetical protein